MTNAVDSGWTEERVDMLKKLFVDGLSFSCIAAAIGGISRNAAIGKASRLGLSGRKPTTTKTPIRRNYSPRQKHAVNPERIAIRIAEAAIAEEFYAEEIVELTEAQRAKAVTLFDLQPHHCRWPYGDPSKPDFVFCGQDRAPERPYCAPHWRIATRGKP